MRKLIRNISAISLVVLAAACASAATDPLSDDVLAGDGLDQVGQTQDDQNPANYPQGETKPEIEPRRAAR